jgi:hypothetical protein
MNKQPTYKHQVLQAELTKMSQLDRTNIPTKTKTSIKVMINYLMDSTIESADIIFLTLAAPAESFPLFTNTSMICPPVLYRVKDNHLQQ